MTNQANQYTRIRSYRLELHFADRLHKRTDPGVGGGAYGWPLVVRLRVVARLLLHLKSETHLSIHAGSKYFIKIGYENYHHLVIGVRNDVGFLNLYGRCVGRHHCGGGGTQVDVTDKSRV
jgi:hypothetical protein